jgi:prevent-host-death family protein
MIVNIHAAKTHLSKLIQRAEAGEDVVIARNGSPAVKLIPFEPAPADLVQTGVEEGEAPSWVGSLKGQIWIAPGSEEPDEELTREMEDGLISPRDDEG